MAAAGSRPAWGQFMWCSCTAPEANVSAETEATADEGCEEASLEAIREECLKAGDFTSKTDDPTAQKQLLGDSRATKATMDEGQKAVLAKAAEEVEEHLLELRADRAWSRLKALRAEFRGADLLPQLEQLAAKRMPLRWMEAWGPIFDHLWETLTVGKFPPPEVPHLGEPPGSGGWTEFHFDAQEDFGADGNMYVRYLPNMHAVECRSEIILPGTFEDHFVSIGEADFSAQLAGNTVVDGKGWRGEIPGNLLYWLCTKPPFFSSRVFWKDIVMHRQLVRHDNGIAAVEYSPTTWRTKSLNPPDCLEERAQTYFRGGDWPDGPPGMSLPKCQVTAGRDPAFGATYLRPHRRTDGSPCVHFRNIQVLEIHFPKWFPLPQKLFLTAAGIVQRNIMRECARVTSTGDQDSKYQELAKFKAQRPSWYRAEWLAEKLPKT
mmetsp:Transcript_37145/g.112142  ORF Transcript_37145/g.112142 Transcript_37145/m.112142 type:complete len:434 (+) Transcript_37145:93-1394(+)